MRAYRTNFINRRSRQMANQRLSGTPNVRSIGPYVTDTVSGEMIAKRDAVRQRGGWVNARWARGTRDRPGD